MSTKTKLPLHIQKELDSYLQQHTSLNTSIVSLKIDELPSDTLKLYEKIIQRLENNEPWEYIQGWTKFLGYKLNVNESVLIPRPETEDLVKIALQNLDKFIKAAPEKKVNVIDIGTGSGAIITALALEIKKLYPTLFPKFNFYATDISKEALKVAAKNIASHELEDTVTLVEANCLESIDLKMDFTLPTLILSNPPYITNIEFSKLNPSVKEYEPELALIAGSDGLDIYREILRQINSLEINTKYILFETSPMVISKLAELADEHFPKSVKAKIKDKFDRERFFEIQPHETTD